VEKELRRLSEDKPASPSLIIQHADKVVVERVEYSSHFGTLDIDSLSGQLNIGLNVQRPLGPDEPLPGFAAPARPAGTATHAGPAPSRPASAGASAAAESPQGARPQRPDGGGPVCRIRPRRPAGRTVNGNKPAGEAGGSGYPV
jgi:hypothetical protein